MKLNIDVTKTEIGGATAEGEFQIKASAKAFAILSSGLYSDKFLAIVRELSCNALDSHIAAGKADVPFTVHLPNKIEPHFSVRDYGVGLDHQGVMEVYTTYFESTKQDSDDFVGCLGLGSKSPFSYTQNFTVIAIKDGIKRLYGCHINERGVPAIIQMGDEVSTDEGNGVEVKFSVEETDFYRFETAAKEALKWFGVKPEIKGRRTEIPEIEVEDQVCEGVRLMTEGSTPIAVMGNVAYPIEASNEFPEDFAPLLDLPLIIDFEIGELDPQPSRERLQYVKHTVDNIISKFEMIATEYAKYARKQITSQRTLWNKVAKADELIKQPIFKQVVRDVVKEIDSKSRYDVEAKGNAVGIVVNLSKFGAYRYTANRVEGGSRWGAKSKLAPAPALDHLFMSPSAGTRVYIDDIKRGGGGRVRKAAIDGIIERDPNNNGKAIRTVGALRAGTYVVRFHLDKFVDNQTELTNHIKWIKRALGGAPVELTSKLPRVYYGSSRGGRYTTATEDITFLMPYKADTSRWQTVWRWEGSPDSLQDHFTSGERIYYVVLKNKTVTHNERVVNNEHWSKLMSDLQNSRLINIARIIGVRKSQISSLTEDCVPLFSELTTLIKQYGPRRIEARHKYRIADSAVVFEQSLRQHLKQNLPGGHFVRDTLEKIDRGIKRNEFTDVNVDYVIKVDQWLRGKHATAQPNLDRAEKAGDLMWQKVVDRYPLIQYLHRRGYRSPEAEYNEEVRKYLIMVDMVNTSDYNKIFTEEVA